MKPTPPHDESRSLASLRDHRWRDSTTLSDPDVSCPTMLTPGELRMLHWLARERFAGDGCIVDAGCFLGGSTQALASGCAAGSATRRARPPIDTYDMFVAPRDAYSLDLLGRGRKPGDVVLDVFEEYLGDQAELVGVHAGEFIEQPVPDEFIEILFVDIAKSEELNQHLVAHYFPKLVPGRSVLVHQDYNFWAVPWIHLSMDHLSEYFVHVADEAASRVYYLDRAIPEDVLRTDSFRDESPARRAERMARILARERSGPAPLQLQLSGAFLIFLDEGLEPGLADLERIERRFAAAQWSRNLVASVRASFEHFIDRAGFESYCTHYFDPY